LGEGISAGTSYTAGDRYADINDNYPPPITQLQEGQLWRLKRGYISIVALRGSNVRFKLLNSPNQAGEPVLSSGTDTLLRYLSIRKSKLVADCGIAKEPMHLTG
jgi:hypothetical protein